ncbi:hypothetical protein RLOC_00008338 [Lonchura striata]|uniref:Uncharacterized protein n=1 Tax=Lonchura striata TaxID=40157 RepID=A0A218UGV3_9PASE|nr:hypothetical protein RLOC_00008338 [Lonchura striata domestica]
MSPKCHPGVTQMSPRCHPDVTQLPLPPCPDTPPLPHPTGSDNSLLIQPSSSNSQQTDPEKSQKNGPELIHARAGQRKVQLVLPIQDSARIPTNPWDTDPDGIPTNPCPWIPLEFLQIPVHGSHQNSYKSLCHKSH